MPRDRKVTALARLEVDQANLLAAYRAYRAAQEKRKRSIISAVNAGVPQTVVGRKAGVTLQRVIAIMKEA